MKMALLVLCVMCVTTAFGQNTMAVPTVNSQPQPIQMANHPEHAAVQPMASEQTLLGSSTYSYARGERPLWEVAPPVKTPTPLGDTARNLKKEHSAVKKANKVVEN